MPREGDYTQYIYDARGNVTNTREWNKARATYIETSASYPSSCSNPKTCNQPDYVTGPRGQVTSFTYDATHGGLTSTSYPSGSGGVRVVNQSYYGAQAWAKFTSSSVTLSPDVVYLPLTTTSCLTATSCGSGSADEARTTIGYFGGPSATNLNVESITAGSSAAAIATSYFSYDAVGNKLTTTDPLGNVSYAFYDADRRVTGTISPDPDGAGALNRRATRVSYDGMFDRVETSEQGTVTGTSDLSTFSRLAKVKQDYDDYGRPTYKSFFGTGAARYLVTQTVYEGAGRVQCEVQRMNPAEFDTLPLTCTRDTDGANGPDRITKYEYNPGDEVYEVKNAVGVSGLEQVTQEIRYTGNGKVDFVEDAKSNRTCYTYDSYDRLIKTAYPHPVNTHSCSGSDYDEITTYDNDNNVTARRLRDGRSISYAYDALNQLTTKTLPSGETAVSYTYDRFGRLAFVGNGVGISYSYDILGRKTAENQSFGTVGYQYDALGRRIRLTYPDAYYVTYSYLNTGELSAIQENGSTVNTVAFTYDDLGRRTVLGRSSGPNTQYAYDSSLNMSCLSHHIAGGTSGQSCYNSIAPIAQDQKTSFTYNPVGQIASRSAGNDAYAWTGAYNVSRNYTANGLNQYSQISSSVTITPTYDTRGNLTSAGGTAYSYSAENQLTSATGATAGTLYYDGLHRVTEYDTSVATRFIYDGPNVIAEVSSPSNSILRRYVHGPGDDEPLVWYEGSGFSDKRWLHADERGSIIAVTNAAGNSIATNSYDAWGIPASTNMGRFQYTGQAYLAELGLYNYKARVYSATLGRFLQADPIGYDDGMNIYAYAGNDPINAKDPSGLDIEVLGIWSFAQISAVNAAVSGTGNGAGASPDGAGSGTGSNNENKPNPCDPKSKEKAKSPSMWDRSVAYLGGFSQGTGDALTGGLYTDIASMALDDADADYVASATQSLGYKSGVTTATVLSLGRLAYAGLARSLTGLGFPRAVIARNNLKGVMSGMGNAHPRIKSVAAMELKYGKEGAAKAAGRTNNNLNGAAGAAAANSAIATGKCPK